ncbi:HNH endonuclease [Xenorhabdus bovienii]|uniref:HNH endonuclease n=1 Tax=Xenorhabdus bovienii TaxID=40576 RepID=UPI003DA206CD
MISWQKLKSILTYDRNTGIFRWNLALSNRIKAGAMAGYLNDLGYIRIMINGKNYAAHRLAWIYEYGYSPDNFIDHINGDKKDNRIVNLREATPYQNMHNLKTPKTNKSGIKGVYWHKRDNKWAVQIQINGKKISLGYFRCINDAKKTIMDAREKYHANFARHD